MSFNRLKVQHLCVRRLSCKDFPAEDAKKIAAFAAEIRKLGEAYFEYEIVTDFFPRPEHPDA